MDKFNLPRLIVVLSIISVSLIVILTSYYSLLASSDNQARNTYLTTANDYTNLLETTFNYTSHSIEYGVSYMKQFGQFQNTLQDFIDLSAFYNNPNISFNSLNVYYNTSREEIPNAIRQMSQQLGKPIVITDLLSNGTFVKTDLTTRSYYCPVFLQTPNTKRIGYYPGTDVCTATSFKKILDMITAKPGRIIVKPRKTTLTSMLVLDFAIKTPTGIVLLTTSLDFIFEKLIQRNDKIKLYVSGEVAYDNCGNCTISPISKQVYLPEIVMAIEYYLDPIPTNLSGFLYVVLSVVLVDFFLVCVLIWLAMQKRRYLLADKMLGYVNHEIRNPLNCIHGLIDICLVDLADYADNFPEVFSNLATAKRACNLLSHIVNDILDVKRINDGKLKISLSTIKIIELMTQIRRIIEPKMLENPDISFTVNIELGLEYLYTDPNRLTQILLNFLTNAIKFTNRGKVILDITRIPDTGIVKFSVKDTGRGIPDSKKSNIFQPFEHVELSDNLRQGGVGLGLYLCKGLVSLMGGKIGFESVYREGSDFWFTLPCLDKPPTDLENV